MCTFWQKTLLHKFIAWHSLLKCIKRPISIYALVNASANNLITFLYVEFLFLSCIFPWSPFMHTWQTHTFTESTYLFVCFHFFQAEQSIKELSVTSGLIEVCKDLSSEDICPVCYCPVEKYNVRLQNCAHLYCSACIKELIAQGQFPIQCCAEVF